MFDDDGIFRDLCEQASSPTLQRISAWGSVHLTRHDMPQLIHEISSLRKTADDAATRALLDALLVLARRCSDLLGSELHLDGD